MTQLATPFQAGLCWAKVGKGATEHFCSTTANKYIVTKNSSSIRVEMYLCDTHVKYMEKSGYVVRRKVG